MTRAPFPASDLSGSDLVTGLDARFKQLYDAGSFPLTSVGGTADDVTATLVPALDGDGLLDGMTFTIAWTDDNTGPMTLAINGGSPVPVVNPEGGTMMPGSVDDGLVSRLVYWGGEFVMVSPTLLMGGSAVGRFSWVFTASGTWNKPDGLPDATPVFVQAWGGGGGHIGGGGGYGEIWVEAGALGATVTVTVGAGGAGTTPVGGAGGNTTFGSVLTAYGGAGATNVGTTSEGATGAVTGGGGGTHEAGGTDARTRAFQGGGRPQDDFVAEVDAANLWGGGAGNASGSGGRAVFGGGGGTFTSSGGGVSQYGGNGGANNVAGTAPGGGGGGNAAGARGEVRVWI